MATHSSVLAWRIPWREESGRLQPWVCKESDTTTHTVHIQSVKQEFLERHTVSMKFHFFPPETGGEERLPGCGAAGSLLPCGSASSRHLCPLC